MHRYGGGMARVGCAMSHFLLWLQCDEPTLILEHDAVFVRPWAEFDFDHVCMVNDPDGATRRGAWWSAAMRNRGPGVYPKTWVTSPADRVPDGLAGNSAYVIKPHAAQALCDLYRRVGVWPNDATMCEQLMPGLQECFPFITKVEQTQSTTSA
jgi:GR25 family glycosyltransferase involved in LPS biosynthesis